MCTCSCSCIQLHVWCEIKCYYVGAMKFPPAPLPPPPPPPKVSVTNTLMNQSVGAHVLATSSGVRKHTRSESEDSDWSDSEESQTLRDNQIRAVWSQVCLERNTNQCSIEIYSPAFIRNWTGVCTCTCTCTCIFYSDFYLFF